MATLKSVMAQLKAKGTEKTKAIYVRHGSPAGRTLGVSTADMKTIAASIKKEQALALELYDTGVLEAMYVAGLVASGAEMTRAQLNRWADGAAGMPMIYDYTVAWVALESADPRALAMEWIASKKEHVAAAGWRTYAGIVTVTPDDKLDLKEIEGLLKKVAEGIHRAPNGVRQPMNHFVISVGGYVAPLSKKAVAAAKEIGEVEVDMGDTACKIPLAADYIAKMLARGKAGVKRKTIRC
jgi:3-methyladenine DNA glycosylase AlkD